MVPFMLSFVPNSQHAFNCFERAFPPSPSRSCHTQVRLPPEVNRVLYVRNLPYKITAEEMYDIFGKYGPIRQIRVGNKQETRGTVWVR